MKRRDLIRYLEDHGCKFFLEGGKHTVYVNRAAGCASAHAVVRRMEDWRIYAKDLGFLRDRNLDVLR